MAYKYPYDEEAAEIERKNNARPTLKTDRKMWKLMLFNLLTLGIYGMFFFMPLSYDLDLICPKKDHTRTFSYIAAYILALFTGNIVMIVWQYNITSRIEDALDEREIDFDFGRSDFWIWYFLGTFFLIGPFVFFHKFCKAMNLLCESYNNNPTIEKE